MLDKILQQLTLSYAMTDVLGAFLSLFDTKGELIASHGTLQTTKSLEELIPVLYNSLVGKNPIGSIVVDIVKDVFEHTDKEKFASLDMVISGLCIVGDATSGVLLPGTVGIVSSKDALAALKKKYNVAGKIRLYSFTTDRIVVR